MTARTSSDQVEEAAPKPRLAWARRELSFEFRFALFLAHREPRGSQNRRQMAHCLREALGRRCDANVLAGCVRA